MLIDQSEARDNHCVIMGALAHEHEYGYTKEEDGAFLRHAHEKPEGTTRRSTVWPTVICRSRHQESRYRT